MSQENKQTPQKHAKKCQECKEHSSRRPRGKKEAEKKTLSEICIYGICILASVVTCKQFLSV
jgi:hypothetical protein